MTALVNEQRVVGIDNSLSAYGRARSTITGSPLDPEELRKVDAYWRATLYLSLGMLYLKENPLLRKPLEVQHIKPRLLGHWGSDAGQSFTWTHFNRLINKYDLNAMFISGPGHGAPAVLSEAYLEGTYSEVYPEMSEDVDGMQRFFKQFSFPGGIGSHSTPETPGSIHEGGELGYSISHAFGTAYDNPDLISLTMVGDGEAETGPLATSWHSTKFLNPITDGAVLPVLHLNGYKINNPTLLARISHEELEALFVGYGYTPYFVEGSDPASMHQAMAATLEHCVLEIRKFQTEARRTGKAFRPRWPMIVLRSPKGWTAPRQVDGHYLEGFWRAHQIPLSDVATNPAHLKLLEQWLRSYKPDELFDKDGKLSPELKALAPKGRRRMSANPVANGGLLRKPLDLPDFRSSAVEVEKPGSTMAGNVPTLGNFLRDVVRKNRSSFRVFGPDETQSNRLEAIYEAGEKVWLGEYFPEDADGGKLVPNGRVMEMLSEHTVEGWLEGYLLSGRHGLINSYEPFIHVIDSMFTSTPSGWRVQRGFPGAPNCRRSICCSPRWSGGRTTTASPTGPASLASLPTRVQTWCGSTCRPTRTACCRSETTACAASTTSTSSSPTSRSTSSTSTWRRRSRTARRALASGAGRAMTRAPSPTWSWRAAATCRRWSPSPLPRSSASTCRISRFASSTWWTCSSWCRTPSIRTG